MLDRFTLQKIIHKNSAWLENQQTNILSAAAIITAANILSSIAGLIRERILIAYFFDNPISRQALEAFQVAFQIPDALFQLLVLGAISAAFIPIFTELKNKDKNQAYAMTSSVMNLVILVFLLASLVIFLFARPLTVWRTGESFTPEQIEIVVKLTKLMLISQLFFAISNFFTGILQSYQRFILPAIAPIVYNLFIVLSLILFYERLGIYAAGVGVILGALFHMLIQYPIVKKLGFKYQPSVNFQIAGLKKLLLMMPPRVATFAVSEIQNLSLGFFATSLGNLSFLIIRLALRLMTIPIRLFGVPIGQASLAFLSEKSEKKDLDQFRSLLINSINQIAFFALPASILLLILRVPIVRLVFGTKNLPWETTLATGKVVAIISISIVAQSIVQLLIRAFHALKDTKTPLVITTITVSLYLIVNFILIKTTNFGINGIAAVTSITAFVELGLFLIFLNQKVSKLITKTLILPQLKILTASFLMSVFLYLPFRILDQLVFETSKTMELIGLTLTTSTIGLLVYLYLSVLLDIKELNLIKKVLHSLDKWRKPLTQATKTELVVETGQDNRN